MHDLRAAKGGRQGVAFLRPDGSTSEMEGQLGHAWLTSCLHHLHLRIQADRLHTIPSMLGKAYLKYWALPFP